MERISEEILKQQLELKEALRIHKIKEQELIGKEVELIDKEIEILKSQLKMKNPLEEIKLKEPKKWYVVFNGPFPGIYDEWYKAAPHCTKISGVTYKGYATKEEAEKAMNDHRESEKSRKEIYLGPRTFSETTKNNAPERTSMKILGRIPSSLDNLPIMSRKEHENQVKFSEEKFKENLKRLTYWTEKENTNCFYMVDRKLFGVKAIITPGASQLLTFNMFQFGLIECLYLSKNLEEINLFPYNFKESVQNFKKNIAGERNIYLKFYSAYPDFTTNQPAKHFVFIGVSNNQFPLRDDSKEEMYDDDHLNIILSNQLSSIFFQCQAIGKNSCMKVLYKAPNFLLLSKTSGKVLKDRDIHLLTSFELPFYAFDKETMNYKSCVLKELCSSIKKSENHACERCFQEKDAVEVTKCLEKSMCLKDDDKDEAIMES
ncbi:uncharacterized protein LOC131618178 [Vicia villosa]|uniref:uncharacterized protein LOC131618178 n=1 Tax=Vicia villosa TaxID=3911 RepID=UPI00273C6983|nr:uncharacterized protein LOC131618178 [Vicia villosa]